jgi:hypothetical protein
LTVEAYALVLQHVHKRKQWNLQKKHDELQFEEAMLQQKRTSGTQGHSTTQDKCNLDKNIKSVKQKCYEILERMTEHVEY